MKKILLLSLLSSLSLFSDDLYLLSYNHSDHKCMLTKNGEKIPFFDKKFDVNPPKSSYACFSVQKEQYKDCKIIQKKNITALLFGYGSYDKTNLILAFQNINEHYDSSVKVKCSQKKYYK